MVIFYPVHIGNVNVYVKNWIFIPLCSTQQSVWGSEVFCFSCVQRDDKKAENYAHTLQTRWFFISSTEWNQSQFVTGTWGKHSHIKLFAICKTNPKYSQLKYSIMAPVHVDFCSSGGHTNTRSSWAKKFRVINKETSSVFTSKLPRVGQDFLSLSIPLKLPAYILSACSSSQCVVWLSTFGCGWGILCFIYPSFKPSLELSARCTQQGEVLGFKCSLTGIYI